MKYHVSLLFSVFQLVLFCCQCPGSVPDKSAPGDHQVNKPERVQVQHEEGFLPPGIDDFMNENDMFSYQNGIKDSFLEEEENVEVLTNSPLNSVIKKLKNISYNRKGIQDLFLQEEDWQVLPKDPLEGSLSEQSHPSIKADFPCPDAAAILPCICTIDELSNIDLDCTAVQSEEELSSVFQQEFPVTNLWRFYMSSNSAVKILGNILNGVTFERVELQPGPFALQAISDYFLLEMRDTLNYIYILNSNLMSDLFPFASLVAMEHLETCIIDVHHFTWIPKILGPSIKELWFTRSNISVIEPGTFDGVPNLRYLRLNDNSITTLSEGSIPIGEEATELYFYGNDLQAIEPGAFSFVDENSAASSGSVIMGFDPDQLRSLQAGTFPFRNGLMSIRVCNHQLSTIDPGTFVMPQETDFFSLQLRLHNNQLTTVDEEVFGELLPYTIDFTLYGNPLECGCDIAWLVLDSSKMAKVDSDATCADGTNLHLLDPTYYVEFC